MRSNTPTLPAPPWPPSATLAAVRADAEARAPQECCGLVWRGPSGVRVEPAANQAAEPTLAFEIAPGALIRGARGLEALAAIYHSHPDGPAALSATDRAAFTGPTGPLWPGVELWVVGLTRGRAVDLARYLWDSPRSAFTRIHRPEAR